MTFRRHPWIVPIAVLAVVTAIYFAIVGSRSSIDQTQLFGNWVTMAVFFVTFAVIAIVTYVNTRGARHMEGAGGTRDHHHH